MAVVISLVAAFLTWFSTLFGAPLSYMAPAIIPHESAHATLLFGGDMMFDRTIRETADQKGGDFLFSCIDPTLQSADLIIANLEGPITSTSSRSVGSIPGDSHNYTFTFPTSTATLLAGHHIAMVNLGNNHIENFGRDGERETESWLHAAHVQYFGDTIEQTVATTTINGIRFAFINYNQFAISSSASTTIAQIRAAAQAEELPIVYTHWGTEYQPATDAEKALARSFVDAGARLVIGSHPHVVQEHETYRGVPIYYSLGNFIFDQYFSDAVDHGLLVRVTFDTSGAVHAEDIPVELDHDRRTCLETATP